MIYCLIEFHLYFRRNIWKDFVISLQFLSAGNTQLHEYRGFRGKVVEYKNANDIKYKGYNNSIGITIVNYWTMQW